jgi:polysaccharide biosynthesis/export protein
MSAKPITRLSTYPGRRPGAIKPSPCPPAQNNPGWRPVVWIVLVIFLLGGCGGAAPQVPVPRPAASQPGPDFNSAIQQQAMLQSTKTSLQDYKDYKLGPEDQLAIDIFGQEKLTRILRVNGQGEITMPLVGTVKVAGKTPAEAAKQLEELYNANYLVNPQVSVSVKEFRHQRVAVTGAVNTPGPYEIIGPRSLLEVLALAGGLSVRSGTLPGDVVNVIRHQNAADVAKTLKTGTAQPFTPQSETVVINLKQLLNGKNPELNLMVKGGDVVFVPFAGTAYVLGGVKKPGNIPVRENLTVSQAVSMGGGVDPIMGTQSITIMRFDENGKPVNLDTNLDRIIAGKDTDIAIKDNDVVVVKESSIKKALYVIRQLVPIPSGGYSLSGM